MAVTQYIGARYVPKFYENSDGTEEWRAGVEYEPLTIVTWNGNSYTSKKPIPSTVGAPSDNPSYWVATGIFNQQIADLTNRVNALGEEIKKYYVTPEMFGAAGDGVTNDTAAMQEAVDTGYIVLLSGEYLIDTVNVTKDTVIYGVGGSVKPTLTGAAPAPTKTAFNFSANGTVEGVDFIGSISSTGDLNRYPVIDAKNIEKLIVKNCSFRDFGGEYVNQSGTAMYDFYAVYIRAVDVDSTVIDGNTFSGRANDETIMVCPKTKTGKTEVTFTNNISEDMPVGASINLFGTVVKVNCNVWNNCSYPGSAVNLACEELYFIDNTFNGCSYQNIVDANEECLFHAEHSIIKNNIVKGAVIVFADIVGEVLTLENNYVEGGGLVKHEITSRTSELVPVVLQNSVKRTQPVVTIRNNTIKVNNSGNDIAIFRVGSLGASNAGLYPAASYTAGGRVSIENNMVEGMGGYVAEKYFSLIKLIFKRISMRNNTVKNINRDQGSSAAKFLIMLDSRIGASDVKTELIDIMGNMFYDMDSVFTNGVYAIGQLRGSDSPAKPVGIIDMFHNHNIGGRFLGGIASNFYDTMNTDIS